MKDTTYKYTYIITSCRAHRRNDEYRNELKSNCDRKVGDTIYLDGLAWTIEEIHENYKGFEIIPEFGHYTVLGVTGCWITNTLEDAKMTINKDIKDIESGVIKID